MENRQTTPSEDWVTSIHEAAHVVFAVLSGRRVQWVTIEPVVVTSSDGNLGICLGRWDISGNQQTDERTIDDRVKYIQVIIAGYLTEYLVTGIKNGLDDEKAATRCCSQSGLDLSAIEKDTVVLIEERADPIKRLAQMLMDHKTLNEYQILQAIYPAEDAPSKLQD